MTVDRRTPTVANFGATIAGNTFADQVDEEILALWDRSTVWLDNITGTANAINATASPTLDAYKRGQKYNFIPTAGNTTAVTININGLGVRSVRTVADALLVGGELVAGVMYQLVDDGTRLRLVISAIPQASAADVQTGIFVYQLAQGTDGGTATGGSRQTYPINTVVVNTIVGASLSTNDIILPAGTYEVEATGVFHAINMVILILRNQTDVNDVAGTARVVGRSASAASAHPTLIGKFTLAGTRTLRLQYVCTTTNAAVGLGSALNLTGIAEQYGYIRFKKVA